MMSELLEITIAPEAPAAGKQLQAIAFPRGASVVAACEGDQLPGPEMVLEVGARYVVAVQREVDDEVVRLLRG